MKTIAKTFPALALLVAGLLYSNISVAQTAKEPTFGEQLYNTIMQQDMTLLMVSAMAIIVAILALVASVYVLSAVRLMLFEQQKANAIAEGKPVPVQQPWWQQLQKKATNAVPVEKENTIILDHNYDGIKELDNHLPPWWMALFYGSIAFGAIYLVVYHLVDAAPLPAEEYAMEMRSAEQALEQRQRLLANSIDENNIELVTDEAVLASGKQIFDEKCAVCHANDGGGNIGPNLTDDYWLHGGTVKDVFSTVKYGVPAKGMISWKSQLPPPAMRDVSCYIMTLVGTTPAKPKEPQGNLYVANTGAAQPDGVAADSTSQQVQTAEQDQPAPAADDEVAM